MSKQRLRPTLVILASAFLFTALLGLMGTPNAAKSAPGAFSCAAVNEIPLAECEVLVSFFDTTGGPNWVTKTDWLVTNTPCTWYEVGCTAGHITSLFLTGVNVTGPIPTVLKELPSLGELHLQRNPLTGPIPTELTTLKMLTNLSLSSNQLSGSIPPELQNLTSLEYLYLGENEFTGPLPPALSKLARLKSLYLHDTHLSGVIPPELGRLTELEILSLGGSHLTGTIPAELCPLVKLGRVGLNNNQLRGLVPPCLINWINLTELNISHNALTCAEPACTFLDQKAPGWKETQTVAPTQIQVHPQSANRLLLTWQPISYTADGGHYEISYATALDQLYTTADKVTINKSADRYLFTESELLPNTVYHFVIRTYTPAVGQQKNNVWSDYSPVVTTPDFDCTPVSEIPQAECQALVALYQSSNGPAWLNKTNWLSTNTPCSWYGVICNNQHVTRLALARNQLQGTLPANLDLLTDLQELQLSLNQVQGDLPPALGKLSKLERLYLQANQLSGGIPATLGNLTQLQKLYLSSNQLSGVIPAELGSLPNLVELSLSENRLSGAIPLALSNLRQLERLYLQDNQLTGTIPGELGQLVKLQKLYLGTNQLHGAIPAELGNLVALLDLDLAYNQLTQSIPAQLGNLVQLQRLYLQTNQLSGVLPPELGKLAALEKLYISFNQVEGEIPSTLGDLANVQELFLAHNQLRGELPPSLGKLTNIVTLTIGANLLSGPLPATLTNLRQIQSLRFRETYLCEPTDAAMQQWLDSIGDLASTRISCTPAAGDAYEADNECPQASLVTDDGVVQLHNFHAANDEDWIKLEARANSRYLIKVDIPADSKANVNLETRLGCNGALGDERDQNFAPGVHLEIKAPQSGPLLFRLANQQTNIAGAEARYELSVRKLPPTAKPGALILVAGSLSASDTLQPNIYHVTDTARQTFINQGGYNDEQIYYLAPDLQHGAFVDALATADNLKAAITTWALDRVGPGRPLTIYLIDHGAKDLLYLDKSKQQWVQPAQIDAWLSQLEAARAGLVVNIVIEACYAGSFIALPETVSKAGRIVLTSTDDTNVAYASQQGAHFSDQLLEELGRKSTIYSSFRRAQTTATTVSTRIQNAWLDGDGDTIPNEPIDYALAAERGFEITGTLSSLEWPPHIAQVEGRVVFTESQAVVQARVVDDVQVGMVWAVSYPLNYTPPTTSEALVRVEDDEKLATFVLRDTDNDSWYSAAHKGFDHPGLYRIVIHAVDRQNLSAQPVLLEINVWGIYLPLIAR